MTTTITRAMPWLILAAILTLMILATFALATHGAHPIAATYFHD